MGRRGDPEDWRLFVILLRSFKNWQAKDLSEASGVSPKMISLYENGKEVPSPETERRLVDAVGFPRAWVEPLLALLHALRLALESGAAHAGGEGDADLIAGLEPQVNAALRLALTPAILELNALLGEERPGGDEDDEEKPN